MKTLRRWQVFAPIGLFALPVCAQPTVTDAPATSAGQSTSGGNATPSGIPTGTSSSSKVVTTTTTTQGAPGLYVPAGSQVMSDNNTSLPSSSRPTSGAGSVGDSFDLNSSGSTSTVRGAKGSFAITGQSIQAVVVPDVHTVKKGDTLWGLCGHYLGNTWDWPRVWSFNPEIRNPNWIYPGDQVRMRSGDETGFAPVMQFGQKVRSISAPDSSNGGEGGFGLSGASSRVPKDTVFLRNEAYIDDPDKDVLGEVVGANEEQMLLSQGNHTYIDVKSGVDLKVGQQLTLFERSRKPEAVDGARQPPGEIVLIKGTIRVTDFDSKTRVARAEVIESNDVIERGTKIGSIGRRYVVVPPKASTVTVWARVLNGIYPHVYWGSQQLVFIDRGSEDGLVAGNRLLVVRRGDTWRQSLGTTARSTRYRIRTDHPDPGEMEPTQLKRDETDFPEEVVGELRVVNSQKWSSLAIVTVSQRELVQGDRAVARKGY